MTLICRSSLASRRLLFLLEILSLELSFTHLLFRTEGSRLIYVQCLCAFLELHVGNLLNCMIPYCNIFNLAPLNMYFKEKALASISSALAKLYACYHSAQYDIGCNVISYYIYLYGAYRFVFRMTFLFLCLQRHGVRCKCSASKLC